MQTSSPLPPSNVFTSWKEIAAYLNKGVRTLQRWEAEFGLPVRRPRERSRGIVHATRQDLDRWLNSTWAKRALRATAMNKSASEAHHQLRIRNQQLMSELHESVSRVVAECNALREQIEHSKKSRTDCPHK